MKDTDTSPSVSLRFVSTCPKCQQLRYQQAYAFRTLVKLLVDNQPIEAYCAPCNEAWPIPASERSELAVLLLSDLDS